DADKEGFLRSSWSLIQMIGRAARNVGGEVVMYADNMTESMKAAIGETNRRRKAQQDYNLAHGLEPATIVKEIHDINEGLRAVARGTSLARDPYARPRRVGEPAPEAPAYEVTSVAVLPAEEEPSETLDGRPPGADGDGAGDGSTGVAPTVSDWLPGIRDEHED